MEHKAQRSGYALAGALGREEARGLAARAGRASGGYRGVLEGADLPWPRHRLPCTVS